MPIHQPWKTSGCFLLLNPLLRRAGNFQAFPWSIGDADTFQIFTLVDQPTDSMVQGTADGFSSVTSAAWRGSWALLSNQAHSALTARRTRLIYPWHSPPAHNIPGPFQIMSVDLCMISRQKKAIHSELWKDIQGLVLILNKGWAIWYHFSFHPLPLKNTYDTKQGKWWKKETSLFFCFTTYLTLIWALI